MTYPPDQPPHGQQPPYGQPPPYGSPPYGFPPPRPTNQNAILALVLSLVFAPLGIIFGNKAKREIAVTGEDGAGLATAGQVIGWIGTGFFVLTLLLCAVPVVFALIGGLAGAGGG